jgi:PhnB protein
MAVKPIPEGYHTLTPYMTVRDAARAIEFYKKAFGAVERGGVMKGPDGKVMHAELRIGDSIIMLADEFPEFGGLSPQSTGGAGMGLHIYVDDVDSAFERAIGAGGTVEMPVADMFWGDRYGKLVDPFGHKWSIATHTRDVSMKEMEEAQEEFMSRMAKAPEIEQASIELFLGRGPVGRALTFGAHTSVTPFKPLLHKYYSGLPPGLIS